MDIQSWIAVSIAAAAGIWAAWSVLRPIINEFRKTKSQDVGCCGCGVKKGAGCQTPSAEKR